jgi:L-threonylcarbamoyladenylate synthase
MEKTIELLRNGGVILYPTDTIWGIGCDATNEEACGKILNLKQRPAQKSFIVLVDSLSMLEKYVPEFHDICYDLIAVTEKPLTIIYPSAKGLAPSVLAEDGSVGIRLTKDPICLQLIRSLKKPIVSTSANISGKKIPASFDEIEKSIKNGVDAIIEERLAERMTTPSQIIKIELNGTLQIIRS